MKLTPIKFISLAGFIMCVTVLLLTDGVVVGLPRWWILGAVIGGIAWSGELLLNIFFPENKKEDG